MSTEDSRLLHSFAAIRHIWPGDKRWRNLRRNDAVGSMAHGWHSSCILKMPNDSKWSVSDIDSIDPILIDTVHGIKTHQSISKPHVSRDFNKSDPSPFAICHGALHATARASSPCLALVGFALRLHVDSLICFMRFTSQCPNITLLIPWQFQGATSLSPYFCWWRLATKSNFAWFLFLRNLVEGWRFVSFRDVAALNATKFEESTEQSSRVSWCLPQTGDKFRSNMNRGSFLPFVGRKWFGPMWTTISFCTFQMYLWRHFAVHLLDIRKLLDIETLEIGSKTLRLQRGLALELSTSHHEFTFHGLRTKSFFSKASMHSIWAREWVHEWLDKRFLDRKASKCESNVSHDGSFTEAKFDPLDDFDGLVSPFSMPFLRYCWFVLALCPAVEGLLLIYAWQRPSDWLAGILSSAYLLLVEAWLQLVFVSSSTLYPYISDFLGCPHCW